MEDTKICTCKCGRKFVAEPCYEYNGESDNDKFIGYGKICPVCTYGIDKGIFNIVEKYQEGLLTGEDLLKELKEYKKKYKL